jgi:4-amino-4-deoxy-L-arabinose transferase-like glycosyltransferase
LVLLAAFALLLFGYAGFSGRPLTMHEARLPECAREMLHRGDWLLPTSGGRPWLERPPLPHWCVIASMKLFGRDDRVWIVRLPSAIAGTVTVLLTAWTAGRLFGRTTAIVAGMMLATSYEFYVYACQAEDDIYLAALVAAGMALFVHAELLAQTHRRIGRSGFVAGRPVTVLGFFTILGLTNLTKGPLIGILFYLGGPAGVFLLLRSVFERSLQPLLRYTWLWGWLMTIALTIAWPAWAYHQYPDVLDNLKYDYVGRMNHAYTDLNEPWYYYLYQLPTALLPWTLVIVIALTVKMFAPEVAAVAQEPVAGEVQDTSAVLNYRRRDVIRVRRQILPQTKNLPMWFAIVWAIVPVLLLSVPSGKHHHYLVPCIAPWAVLSAVAGGYIVRRVQTPAAPGANRADPAWFPPVSNRLGRGFFAGTIVLGLGYSFVQSAIAATTDHTLEDTAFLLRVRSEVPTGVPLFIDAKLGPPGNLDFFRTQFYSRPSAVLIHNLSFLRDEKIHEPVGYVICRTKDEPVLATLGTVVIVDQSKQSHEERDDKAKAVFGKFTLYRLTFFPTLRRYPAPAQITSLQAMERAPGPWCGPPLK